MTREDVSSGLLRVRGVSKTFAGRRPVEALQDVSLHVDTGEFVSIIGPSGCGKSTLFNLISGIESATSGSIEVLGAGDPDLRRSRCGYMFQKDLLLPWRNVLDNAALGLEVSGLRGKREARESAQSLLPLFGLQGFEHHRPSELSGGMRQRVALLRTLLLQRPLLLLDEPFASLDALTRRELQTWLADTWRIGAGAAPETFGADPGGSRGALLVTHDIREAVLLSHRVYVMSPRPGRIVAEIEIDRGIDGTSDPQRQARAEEAILQALRSQHIAV